MTEWEARELWLAYCRGEIPGLPPKDAAVPDRPDLAAGEDWRGWVEWIASAGVVKPVT
jgi:hypothetical protein